MKLSEMYQRRLGRKILADTEEFRTYSNGVAPHGQIVIVIDAAKEYRITGTIDEMEDLAAKILESVRLLRGQ